MDRPRTTYSVQDEDELWPSAKTSHLSKRADGTIRDRPGERMFSAHAGERQNSDHVEG
ncbi:MAG: small acid-soluble spore protein K [Sporolactobacillus sp.]